MRTSPQFHATQKLPEFKKCQWSNCEYKNKSKTIIKYLLSNKVVNSHSFVKVQAMSSVQDNQLYYYILSNIALRKLYFPLPVKCCLYNSKVVGCVSSVHVDQEANTTAENQRQQCTSQRCLFTSSTTGRFGKCQCEGWRGGGCRWGERG